ncbi:hypothetical protein RRG08_041600 [Elysia crispata]|uniref:Uncharacterized protein n=1 Tax=Elysia crispata TaxID=231223 RepID=A0AAE1AZX0_9GAST|nr:hypothetical protein RRG08_041600 [Elysia crispata]
MVLPGNPVTDDSVYGGSSYIIVGLAVGVIRTPVLDDILTALETKAANDVTACLFLFKFHVFFLIESIRLSCTEQDTINLDSRSRTKNGLIYNHYIHWRHSGYLTAVSRMPTISH